jgi:hypothetical protein
MTADLEQIVAEVLRRLMAAGGEAMLREGEADGESRKQPTVSLAAVGGTSGMAIAGKKGRRGSEEVLQLDDRVVTLATLEGKLDSVRRLVVHRKAIVTPAVREELSRREIELDRGGKAGEKKAEAAIHVVRFEAENAPALQGLGLASDVTTKTVAALVQRVSEVLGDANQLSMVLTRKPIVALCALNRRATIRAALATNVDSVRVAVKQLAANVLVVDPAHLGRVQLSALVRAFENEGLRPVPSELREVLS